MGVQGVRLVVPRKKQSTTKATFAAPPKNKEPRTGVQTLPPCLPRLALPLVFPVLVSSRLVRPLLVSSRLLEEEQGAGR